MSSPTVVTFPTTRPKHTPNPHPYAIKTTSTALLSRSNSSPGNPPHNQHSYVPPSPSPSPTRRGHGNWYRGHRYSKSLSDELPSPIPIPPGYGAGGSPSPTRQNFSADTISSPTRRLKRADTLPPSSPQDPSASHLLTPSPSIEVDHLPSNPKTWTPAQLSTYLATALRVRSGSLPDRVVGDVAKFVREMRIGGKVFLRLNEQDFEQMGINKLWRTALLNASRNLRQNVVKGRIWGFGNEGDDEDLDGDVEGGDANNLNPFGTENSSESGSGSEVGGGGVRNGYRNGRVKGMVETLERSSSFSEGEADERGEARSHHHWRRLLRHRGGGGDGNSRNGDGSVSEGNEGAWSEDELWIPASHRIPPPPPPAQQGSTDEPSIEDLVASSSPPAHSQGSWGARAWEDDRGEGGVTMKRLPVLSPSGSGRLRLKVKVKDRGLQKEKEDGEGGVNRKGERNMGYRAWEDVDEVMGATVKKVHDAGPDDVFMEEDVFGDEGDEEGEEDNGSEFGLEEEGKEMSMTEKRKVVGRGTKSWDGKGKGKKGKREGEGKRRVVTAIFAGIGVGEGDGDGMPEIVGEEEDEKREMEENERTEHDHKVLVSFDDTIDPGVAINLGPSLPPLSSPTPVSVPPDPSPIQPTLIPELDLEEELALEKEMTETREMVEDLKRRLEEVERKVDEMAVVRVQEEEEEEEGRKRGGADRERRVARGSSLPSAFIGRILGLIYPSSSSPSTSAGDTLRNRHGMTTYALLVGIGACAVVLNVVLRRVGRKLKI